MSLAHYIKVLPSENVETIESAYRMGVISRGTRDHKLTEIVLNEYHARALPYAEIVVKLYQIKNGRV